MSGRPTALVTGASSGIGQATAHLLASAGYDLVLVARRQDQLRELAERLRASGAQSEVLPCDLGSHDGLRRAVQRAGSSPVDLLVSNAGVGGYHRLAEVSPQQLQQLWRLNATAHIELAHAVLPGMLQRRSGGIVVVASLLAFSAGVELGFPRSLYVGAKASAVAFTRTLALELGGTGVRTMAVCPGLVDTEWGDGRNHADPRAMSAEDVAQALWHGFRAGELLCVPALADASLVDSWLAAEPTLLTHGNRATLATRYQS